MKIFVLRSPESKKVVTKKLFFHKTFIMICSDFALFFLRTGLWDQVSKG